MGAPDLDFEIWESTTANHRSVSGVSPPTRQ